MFNKVTVRLALAPTSTASQGLELVSEVGLKVIDGAVADDPMVSANEAEPIPETEARTVAVPVVVAAV